MSSKRRRKKNKNSLIIKFILILIGVFLLGVTGFFIYLNGATGAYNNDMIEAVSIIIPNGASTSQISTILVDNEIIGDKFIFEFQSRLKGNNGKYKAGEYQMAASMDMDELMKILLEGKSNTIRFTIPEGYDIRRTIDKLESENLINRDIFMNEIKNGDYNYRFLEDAPSGENRLEGFLYPNTYDIYTTASERDIITKLLNQFDIEFKDEYYDRAEELGMTINEVIVLASIIEREAVISEDRPIISGVFHNRLDIDMPLQSCATVQYILGEQKPVLSFADLEIESPYNTYKYGGLPPGPICSPGIESIKAALYPTDSEYLFFLAKGDGSHVFSKTYAEHMKYYNMYIK